MKLNLADAAALAQITVSKQQDLERFMQLVVAGDADPDVTKIQDRVVMMKIMEAQAVILIGLASVHFFRADAQSKAKQAAGIQIPNLVIPSNGRG